MKTTGLKQDINIGTSTDETNLATDEASSLFCDTMVMQRIIAMLLKMVPKLRTRIFKLLFFEIAADCSEIGCLPVL